MMNLAMITRLLLIALTGLLLTACSQNNGEQQHAIDDAVLATVAGTPVTESELQLNLEKIVGDNAAFTFTSELREKALQSLVMTRAIAQRQSAKMDAAELRLIEQKTQRYREELLVEAYLRANTEPLVPTAQQVKQYYDQHRANFGASEVKTYELLRAQLPATTNQLQRLLQQLATAKQQSNWHSLSQSLQAQGIDYIRGSTAGPDLQPELQQAIDQLAVQETSNVIYLNKIPHLVRVNALQQHPPKPLREVSTEIRRLLATKGMKTSIKAIAEDTLATADVVYMTADNH